MNKLYFGDNLRILREHIADESIDLVYLDPPFNSKRDYSIPRIPLITVQNAEGTRVRRADYCLRPAAAGWHWGGQAEREYTELLHQPNTDVSKMIVALQDFLGKNDMMAYLIRRGGMANRLLELHRVDFSPEGTQYPQPRVKRSGTLGTNGNFIF